MNCINCLRPVEVPYTFGPPTPPDAERKEVGPFCETCNGIINFHAVSTREPPLLMCVDCKNTESCAGAMARAFNKGRCLYCAGYFKVVRA